ncbi:hypothetical protein O6H91_Y554400 [Diphasiastrum complanatum]|nr:hypothetical protein O6H91_Y554400 [Diphasiastrum complanatum]
MSVLDFGREEDNIAVKSVPSEVFIYVMTLMLYDALFVSFLGKSLHESLFHIRVLMILLLVSRARCADFVSYHRICFLLLLRLLHFIIGLMCFIISPNSCDCCYTHDRQNCIRCLFFVLSAILVS